MKIAVVKDVEVAPLNILAYVDDNCKHLSGEEITRFVSEIIRFAPPTYTKEDIRTYLENSVYEVFRGRD